MTWWQMGLVYFVASIPSSLIIARMLRRIDASERREQLRERGVL